jgi:CHAT domain-containing protein/tetratricopeptide (TPR) repeat protein
VSVFAAETWKGLEVFLSFHRRRACRLRFNFFIFWFLGSVLLSCTPHRSPRQDLVSALGGQITIEGRFTGNLPFALYAPATRLRTNKLFNEAARRIRVRAAAETPTDLADLAFLQLLVGRTQEALATLERAVELAPQDAFLQNDLAAAYVARAERGGRPFDLVRALTFADRALQLEPNLSEALFNRALILDKLAIKSAAGRAWREVAAREPVPGWRHQALANLRSFNHLATADWGKERARLWRAASEGNAPAVAFIVEKFPQPARLYVEEELLALWANQSAEGLEKEANLTLTAARTIGSALLARHGDAMIYDAIATIDRARTDGKGRRFQRLIEGHRFFGRGLHLYQSHDIRRALPELLSAERELRNGRTPFVEWATIYIASCNYFRANFEQSYAALEDLERKLPTNRYPSLQVRIDWILGSIDILKGKPGDALPRFRQGKTIDEGIGELDDLAGMLQHMALIYWRLGDAEEAWKYLLKGLQLTHRLQSPQRYFSAFDEASLSCLERDYPNIALYFQGEMLRFSLHRSDPEQLAYVRKSRVRALARLGRLSEARREAVLARSAAKDIKDERIRGRMEADILVAEAEAILPVDTHQAINNLSRAIQFCEIFNYRLDLPMSYFQRAHAYQIAGQGQLAEEDFHRGLEEIEKARESIAEPRLRIALQDQAALLLDDILSLMAAQGRIEDAFEISERSHARQLLEDLSVASFSPALRGRDKVPLLSLAEIQRELPERTVLVKYVVLRDHILIWSLGRKAWVYRSLPIKASDLKSLAERVRLELRTGGGESASILCAGYEKLVAPIAQSFSGMTRVVFVPDGGLSLLPFSALINPRTGRYLIQDFSVVISPGANVYIRCLRRSLRQESDRPKSILAIGANHFDYTRFPSLLPLARADDEATRVAGEYLNSRLLIGNAPSRDRFLAEMRLSPEVIHFAGHSILNEEFPEMSMLILVPGPGKNDSGVVYAHEVYQLRLDYTRVVVLAACDTASGKLSNSEGALGLARPFLAIGVPCVLASLGTIDDALSEDLMVQFHRYLQSGEGVAEALRSAQINQIKAGSESAKRGGWALFEIIGASAP